MGPIDVDELDQSTELIDDEVFADSDYSSVRSDTSTWIDDEPDKCLTVIRDDAGAQLCRVQLGRLLGAGGFGRVYEGQLESANRRRRQRIAVKVPRRRAGGEASTDSFQTESALVGLRHPNVVSILVAGWSGGHLDERSGSTDSRCDEKAVDMIPAVVMEFAGRRNLQSVVDDPTQTLSLRRRVNYAQDVSSALSYIHRRRVVHLDVKPANIIITDSDRCKLTDFGCSQRLPSTSFDDEASWPRRPASPTFNGTFAYRAPELLRGAAPTPAADVYSLGVTLWQLRSRSAPYAGRDWHAVIFAVVAYHDRPDTSPALRRRHPPARRPSSPVAAAEARTPDRRYRNVFRSCWDADADARPTAVELERLFQTWRTELDSISSMDSISSTSSLDTDDI